MDDSVIAGINTEITNLQLLIITLIIIELSISDTGWEHKILSNALSNYFIKSIFHIIFIFCRLVINSSINLHHYFYIKKVSNILKCFSVIYLIYLPNILITLSKL